MTAKKQKIAYMIPQRVAEHNLEVIHSANAWWMDQVKVSQLVAAFSIDMTIREACIHAGITERQYKYFAEIHPVINEIRKDCRAWLRFRARKTMIDGMLSNPRLAMRYLQMTEPEEWGRRRGPSPAAMQKKLNEQMKEHVARDREEYSR